MDILRAFGASAPDERALWLLALSVGALIGLAILFAIYTIVLRVQHEVRQRRWARLTELWEEPLLAALADPEEVQALHDAVEPRYSLHFVRFVLEYARRVSGDEKDVLRTFAAPYLGPIAERAWSTHREVRTRAVQTLGTLGLPTYATEVVTALDDPSPLVAMVAARALCRKENPEYAPAVLKRLARFEGWNGAFMASMLAAVGPDAAPTLREVLEDNREVPWVRAIAADALWHLSDLESADAAAGVVEVEDDHELITAALRLLTAVGGPEHAPVVRVRCASPDFGVRAQALSALGTLGDEEDAYRLLGAMSDPSAWVAIHAAESLVEAGAIPLLRDLGDSDHPRAELAKQVLSEVDES